MNILVGTFKKIIIICQVLLLTNTDRLMNGRKEKEETEKKQCEVYSQQRQSTKKKKQKRDRTEKIISYNKRELQNYATKD